MWIFLIAFELTINFQDLCSQAGAVGEVNSLVTLDNLTPEQRTCVEGIRSRLERLAATSLDGTLRATSLIEHCIRLVPDAQPIKQHVRPVSAPIRQDLHEQLDELIKQGVVEKSESPWCSPLVLLKKKDGSYRMCHDARKLNSLTVKDSYPLPNIQATLDMLRGASYISSIDLKSAFFQVPLAEDSRPLTAFAVPGRGLWQFKRMPFGLCNSGSTFQRLTDAVIAGLENCFGYLDDLVLVSSSWEEHVSLLNRVIERLERANLTVNLEKCELFKSSLVFLGYVVDSQGLRASQDKIKAVVDFPRMRCQRDVRRFLGLCSYYRRFVPNFSRVAGPLCRLLQKNQRFHWTLECEKAFAELKQLLTSAPVLAVPDFSLPFVIHSDASKLGLGAMISQKFPEGEKVIAYASRTISKAEAKWTVTELECLGIVWAVHQFRPYIEGTRFTVVTDHHSLKWLNGLKDPSPRLARWALKLQAYDFEIEYRKGGLNRVPDALSRAPLAVESVELVAEQITDPWYLRLRDQIEENPDRFPLWRVEDGKVFKFLSDRDELVNTWKLVIPKEKRPELLEKNHDAPHAGHFGVYKTLKRIASDYYWPKMRRDVQVYVARCKKCLAYKIPTSRPAGEMGRYRVTRPWELIAMDFTGKYPRSPRRNEYLLTVQCLFSKFILVFPLTNSRAATLVKILEEKVFCCFGTPGGIVCDNGSQFTSREFTQLMESKKVRIRYTALYHPQADPVERAHRDLKRMMASFMVGQNHSRWDEFLPQFQLAMNSSMNEATRCTPASIFFNHPVKEGNRELLPPGMADLGSPGDNVSANKERALDVQKHVAKNLDQQFEKNRKRYNLRRVHREFQVGDSVWHKNFPLSSAADKFSKKLAPKFVGPFKIKERHGGLVYSLEDEEGKPAGKWHIQDLIADRQDDGLSEDSSCESADSED